MMTELNSSTYTARSRPFQALFPLLVFFVLAVLVACVPVAQESSTPKEVKVNENDGVNTARLSLFLNLNKPNGPSVRLELTDLEVLAGQTWLPVTNGPLQLDSEKIAASQVFLGGRAVPPGRYDKFRFTVTKSSFRRESGEYQIINKKPYSVELILASPFILEKDNSQSFFVTWDVLRSLERPEGLYPVMSVVPSSRQLFLDLVYVACPDIDTIFVIRSDKNWVVDSFGIRGHPTYIAMDPDPANQQLYVLAPSESRIKVVELNSERVVNTFSIPFIRNPSFMTISSDGQRAYVLDGRESYLNLMDLESGRLLARVRVGYEPKYAAYLADRNILAVSSVISQTVSFHDPLTLTILGSVPTGNSPDGLLFSNNRLLIAESGANTVSVFNFESNVIESTVSVGLSPRRLLDNGNQIYVSNYDDGSISVIYPGQLAVGQEVRGLGRPLEMVYDSTYRRIYVGDEQEAGLAVIDSNVNQLTGYIKFGARPLGLAVFQ